VAKPAPWETRAEDVVEAIRPYSWPCVIVFVEVDLEQELKRWAQTTDVAERPAHAERQSGACASSALPDTVMRSSNRRGLSRSSAAAIL
jgi:hypothetical protein